MKFNFIKNILSTAVLLGTALLFVSCDETNSEELGPLNKNFATRTIIEANLIYKDSGEVRVDLKSPLIEEFELIDSPYTIMRNGLTVEFWNDNNPKANFLRADWAKINDRKRFYEGKGNVVMINNNGDTLKTQHIFWDNLNRRIFTKDTVHIIRPDGTFITSNHGLDATEDFKAYTFFQNHGVFMYDEEGQKKGVVPGPTKSQSPQKNAPIIKNPPKEKLELSGFGTGN